MHVRHAALRLAGRQVKTLPKVQEPRITDHVPSARHVAADGVPAPPAVQVALQVAPGRLPVPQEKVSLAALDGLPGQTAAQK